MSSAEKEVHDDESEELLCWLQSPSAYPHKPQKAECVQTHISWVFLAGDHGESHPRRCARVGRGLETSQDGAARLRRVQRATLSEAKARMISGR